MEKLSDTLRSYIDKIVKEYSISSDKILVSSSICSDETNNTCKSLFVQNTSLFHLGGFTGYPHTGPTGLNAYLDHIPDDGAGLIVYGLPYRQK